MFWSQHLGCWGQNTSRIQNKGVYATLCFQSLDRTARIAIKQGQSAMDVSNRLNKEYMEMVDAEREQSQASDSHLDLDRAPYVLYGVKYIDLVSLAPFPGHRADTGPAALGFGEQNTAGPFGAANVVII